MSTRKIKDAKDLSDGSLIYFKGHAKATYMSDGSTVEDTINNIKVNGGGGGTIDLSKYETKTDALEKFNESKHYTDIKIQELKDNIGTQTIELRAGWNWVSFCIETSLDSLLGALSNKGLIIATSNDGTSSANMTLTYNELANSWDGNLTVLDFTKMYQIQVSEDCTISVTGKKIKASDLDIILNPGWTFISYPLDKEMPFTEALSYLIPAEGDRIKGKSGEAMYEEGYGWDGNMDKLKPNQGYMFYSASSEVRILRYPSDTVTKKDLSYYYTKIEIDNTLGNINEVLDLIINT
jgi:hypothetical protein